MPPAVTPGALDAAAVETCMPVSLAKVQVASTPENGTVQFPVAPSTGAPDPADPTHSGSPPLVLGVHV